MRTIPDEIIEKILADQPRLAAIVANLRANPERAEQFEKPLAFAYLDGPCTISAMEAWHLAQVAYGGPWGGDWVSTAKAASLTGYDESHLRRLAGAGALPAIKRGKVWYIKRDALPAKTGGRSLA